MQGGANHGRKNKKEFLDLGSCPFNRGNYLKTGKKTSALVFYCSAYPCWISVNIRYSKTKTKKETKFKVGFVFFINAGIAQSVEQRIRNA